MRLSAANSSATGSTYRDGRGEFAGAPVAQPGKLADDLVECGIDVIRELDLRDRFQPVYSHPDGRRDNTAFGDGSIEHTMLAILPLQAVRAAEDATEIANVFAEYH